MAKIIWHSLLFFGLFIGSNAFGQEQLLEKAKEQYNRYKYIDAQNSYLKLYNDGYESAELFKNLGNTYYFIGQLEEANQWYEKLFEKFQDNAEPEYLIRYVHTLKSLEKYDQANDYLKQFSETQTEDSRAKLFINQPDYLAKIEYQSGRYDIKNSEENSEYTDFGAAFLGDKVVIGSSRDTLITRKFVHQWNDEPFLDLYQADADSITGELSNLIRLDDKINSRFHESTPVFTKDGNTVYFTRNNFEKRKYGRDEQGNNNLKIYRTTKNEKGEWERAKSLPFNENNFSSAHPALSPDEKTLYFSSDRPGGKGMSDIYKVDIFEDGTFGEPENLGDKINTEGKETFPFISEKNDLYFSSDGHNGLGGLDVFVNRLFSTDWRGDMVVNVGKPVNGPKDDFAYIINDQTKLGYFSSNRAGGKGKDDIFSFIELEELRSFCETYIVGVVKDSEDETIIPGATVTIMDAEGEVLEEILVGEDGTYTTTVKIKCDDQYFVKISKLGYTTAELLVETPEETGPLDLSDVRKLRLIREVTTLEVGDDLAILLNLKPIYFDFNDYLIRDDAKLELAKVIDVLKQYPEMKIEIRSHTDSRADDNYNIKLSRRRAVKTANYIAIIGGISRDRLSSKGLGESELLNECKNGIDCTDEEHQLNRRSEFIIIEQ